MHTAAQEDFFADIPSDKVQHADSVSNGSENSKFKTKSFVSQKFKYGLKTPNDLYHFERNKSGISQIKTDFFGELQVELASSIDFRLSVKAELESYKWSDHSASYESHNEDLLLRDAFLDFTFFDGHWLRIGHQLFAWGESESIAVTDVLAVRDLREFAQAELQDIREQIPAVLYSFPVLGGTLSIASTYDAGHNRYAREDDEFYPFIQFKELPVSLRRESVDDNFEYAFRYVHQFNGSDLSIVAADINDNEFALSTRSDESAIILLSQERMSVLGLTANRVFGSWLVKSELARYYNHPTNTSRSFYISDQDRGVFGIEYSGIDDWFFSYELSLERNRNEPSYIERRHNHEPGHTFHLRHSSLRDRLHQDFWYLDLVGNQGEIMRWDLSYDWSDSLTVSTALVIYDSPDTDSFLEPFKHHDSFNFSLKYFF